MGCGGSKEAYNDPNAYAKPPAGGPRQPMNYAPQQQPPPKQQGRGKKAAKNLGFISMLTG
ncbi:hypothetical protein CLAFUW4_14262 [Fulvia fulva]|uniref:Uncharacterized protein n=1 Tax=Passalora fulva TaxID=5499 RepID=A0A9Q8PMV6_PASFU|nr:uncharacterized protein CLAFUR5_14095 [Fulvia fulva]KAK4609335.1 hypothetical protein CLAFUR4_14263 [Fulvia fulva]KAK4609760.1 hypothetical protein CLAFUR0_14267 [Fulvia fulva]UJO25398.1 hypothetical protein CLAFUR5_14095 [Fulvia fulva]WPV22943.1 hypothetical protein CLAFUW4_14262 [Fulvia fulva]WPV37573.1 hypothetical protein CLAFUW7_14271 [Fulvia fulva]